MGKMITRITGSIKKIEKKMKKLNSGVNISTSEPFVDNRGHDIRDDIDRVGCILNVHVETTVDGVVFGISYACKQHTGKEASEFLVFGITGKGINEFLVFGISEAYKQHIGKEGSEFLYRGFVFQTDVGEVEISITTP
ncbi:hypothetical protein TSUD_113740 [Trifolium subterraneum]|uniref:Uncharacterized protein n=1 Tax=Trifolium subterraneum TaxID=3900 RepID=A0A2Z6M6L0_TRISU|nr:hypothetical protein TSUD_113740 [Trifolium subterraneum]